MNSAQNMQLVTSHHSAHLIDLMTSSILAIQKVTHPLYRALQRLKGPVVGGIQESHNWLQLVVARGYHHCYIQMYIDYVVAIGYMN